MKKTLIVSYLPRGERSNTKKLLDRFKDNFHTEDVQHLELSKTVPDLFLPDNLLAYILRNMVGEKISPEQEKSLEKMDKMTKQLKEADNLVLAFPMYNFSMPATVKAWFDSVMLKGETWDIDKEGQYIGLLKDKRALVLMASGGSYDEGSPYEFARSLTKLELGFMGISDVTFISAEGMMSPDAEKTVEDATKKVAEFAKTW